MLINIKKNVFHRTDTRTTQNYSSEPHKNNGVVFFFFFLGPFFGGFGSEN
jgi:hypothetical protein